MPCLSPSGLEQVLACFVCQHRHGQSGEEIRWNPKRCKILIRAQHCTQWERKTLSRSQQRVGRDHIETHSRDMLFLTLPYSSSKVTDTKVWLIIGSLWFSGFGPPKVKLTTTTTTQGKWSQPHQLKSSVTLQLSQM